MTRAPTAPIAAVACGAVLTLFGLGAAGPDPARRGEVVVRNQSFSALEVSVVVGGSETRIGSAPPEFTNTLYFPIPADGTTLRFRARLPGAPGVLHASNPVVARAGMRIRWTLPDNRVDPLDR